MMAESAFVKLRITVPVNSADSIRKILGEVGAGVQGNYTHCTGSYRQIGRFKPLPGANPTIGEVGKLEEVEEEVIETLCHKNLVKEIISAIKKIHPYEEPAID